MAFNEWNPVLFSNLFRGVCILYLCFKRKSKQCLKDIFNHWNTFGWLEEKPGLEPIPIFDNKLESNKCTSRTYWIHIQIQISGINRNPGSDPQKAWKQIEIFAQQLPGWVWVASTLDRIRWVIIEQTKAGKWILVQSGLETQAPRSLNLVCLWYFTFGQMS